MRVEMGELEVVKPRFPYNCFGIQCKFTLINEENFKKETSVSAYRNRQGMDDPVTKEEYAEALELIAKQLRELKL